MSQTTLMTRPATAVPTARPASSLGFTGPASMTALPANRCHPIALCGPEDVVVDTEAGIAYVSSQARPLGFGARGYAQPGAIYTLRLGDPTPEPQNAMLRMAEIRDGFDPTTFHPHGIDLSLDEEGRARLFAINHTGEGSRIEVFDILDRASGKLGHTCSIGPHAALTNPNDIAAVSRKEFYLTNSHDSEQRIVVMLEEMLHMRTGSVVHCRFEDQGSADMAIVEKGFSLLSGIAVDPAADPKRVYVAPLWANKIIVYDQGSSGELVETGREIPIPGGADNLTFDPFGSLWIGAVPDFGALTAYGLGDRETAPSLVLRIPDPTAAKPQVERVFTDDGGLISAASAAACYEREGRRRLLVGAPYQDRMLIIDLA